jgi:hypothetical protein
MPVPALISFSITDTFTTILGAMWFHIPPQCTQTPLNFHTWNDRFTHLAGQLATGMESKIEHMTNYELPLSWGTSLIHS